MGWIGTGRRIHADTYRNALRTVWAMVEENYMLTVTPPEDGEWFLYDDTGFKVHAKRLGLFDPDTVSWVI